MEKSFPLKVDTRDSDDKINSYKQLIQHNGDFNWVNSEFMSRSQTVIDFDDKNLKVTDTAREFVTSFLETARGQGDLSCSYTYNDITSNNKSTLKSPVLKDDEKFIKNKTVNSRKVAKLGLLIQYQVETPKILNLNFNFKKGFTEAYIYRIQEVKKESQFDSEYIEYESGEDLMRLFCILSAAPLMDNIPIKLLSGAIGNSNNGEDSNQKQIHEQYRIIFTEKVKISKSMFEKLITFHHRLFIDLCSFKDFECPSFIRLTDKNSDERKYLISPIIFEKSKWKFDEILYLEAFHLNKNTNNGVSLDIIINQQIQQKKILNGKCSVETTNLAKSKIDSKLNESIFFTPNKLILYDIHCVFYSHESSEIFFSKIAYFHNKKCVEAGLPEKKLEDVIIQLKTKYFPSISYNEFENLSTYELLLEAKTSCESINSFRKMSEIGNMIVNFKDAVGFGYGTPIKPISNFDFTYKKNVSISVNSQTKVSKLKSDVSIYNIFPLENLHSYFIDKCGYKFLSKLPTILTEFERILLSQQFCQEFIIQAAPSMMNYIDLQPFIHALSSPGLMQDYSFESLETLGDTIIKFVLTTCIHYSYPNLSEGKAQNLRKDLLKNDKLQEIAIGSLIYKYILNLPLKVSKWEPPLKRSTKITFEQSIAKKCAADSLEALVGACYMKDKTICSCLNFMRKVKIITDDLMINKNVIEKFNLKEYEIKWTVEFSNSNIEQNEQDSIKNKSDLSFIEIFFSNKAQSKFEVHLPFSHVLQNENGKINPSALNCLEKRINYKFKDPSILISAFTHQSYTKDVLKSYQRLELLGDSILEVYLLIRLFLIFEDKLFDPNENYDKNFLQIFNCGNLTHAKSLLVSNYFLMRLIVLLNLQEFILIKDINNIEKIEIFFDENNILHLLNQKINEYSTKATGSKILSDVFEALLGAIFVDSNLQKCFDFLDSIYEPFLYYTTTNLQNIKYSPVSEFIEICHKKFGVGPKFSKTELQDKTIQISVWANDHLICQGIGSSEDSAKEKAVLEGMCILKEEGFVSMKLD